MLFVRTLRQVNPNCSKGLWKAFGDEWRHAGRLKTRPAVANMKMKNDNKISTGLIRKHLRVSLTEQGFFLCLSRAYSRINHIGKDIDNVISLIITWLQVINLTHYLNSGKRRV